MLDLLAEALAKAGGDCTCPDCCAKRERENREVIETIELQGDDAEAILGMFDEAEALNGMAESVANIRAWEVIHHRFPQVKGRPCRIDLSDPGHPKLAILDGDDDAYIKQYESCIFIGPQEDIYEEMLRLMGNEGTRLGRYHLFQFIEAQFPHTMGWRFALAARGPEIVICQQGWKEGCEPQPEHN